MILTSRNFLVVTFVLCASLALAQNQRKADSVLLLLDREKLNAEDEIKAYYWLSAYSSSPAEELKYGKVVLGLARDTKNKEYVIKANQRIGVANRLLGNLAEALAYLFRSAEEASKSEEYKPLLADIYAEISSCYTQKGDSKNALRYGAKTIEILRVTGNQQRLGITLLNTGYDYYLISQYDSAMTYYNESEKIMEEINLKIGLAYITGNRALVYWKTGNIAKAKKDLNKAIGMLEPLGDTYAISDYYNKLGNIFLEENEIDKATATATSSFEMAKQDGLKEQIRDASALLFKLYRKAGDYQNALAFQTEYYSYKDSINDLENTELLANQRVAFEIGQKQAEVDLLLEQRKNNQIIMVTGGSILLIVLIVSLLMYSFYKSKSRLNLQLEEQKNSLLDVNNTKDKFFSIISHDLRGPVSTLSGLVSVTKYFVDEKKPDQLKEMLDKMEISVNHLVKLLDNLLHWALQQRGHFPYVPENINLKKSLNESAEMFRDMAMSKNIKLNIDCEENVMLFIDKNTTSTIFRNLLNNAIKFTPNDGKIGISAKSADGAMAVIKFTDSGVGIPAEKLASLFKLGENGTTRGTSGEAGLGLGLQLVYDFVELNQGKIEVESEVGKGTTFTVFLPLSTSEG